MAGIYLHIPFCNSKCIYCGFYSVVSKDFRNKFIPALKREILGRRNFFSSLYPSDRLVKTLYIGGGTPSVLDISILKEAISLLRDEFSFPAAAFQTDNPDEFEFTVEVNPDDITPDYAHSLRQLGVNRVSMGVQSFQDTHLKWMCRRHTSLQAVEAFNTLRCAGFRNISLDLIFGFPLMTEIEWADNLDKVVSLGPEHISAYQLGIDPGTPLERLAEKGRFSLPGDETCEKMYKTLQSRLAEAGYFQYEVSNFCLKAPSSDNQEHFKDYRSRHNSSYWKRIPYLGLGPGAHGAVRGKEPRGAALRLMRVNAAAEFDFLILFRISPSGRHSSGLSRLPLTAAKMMRRARRLNVSRVRQVMFSCIFRSFTSAGSMPGCFSQSWAFIW